MKYISEEDLRAYLINDGCDDGCGYLDERDIPSLPWIELDATDDDVLDKIRAEIEEQVLESLSDGGDDWFVAEKVNECLDIIDKYREEIAMTKQEDEQISFDGVFCDKSAMKKLGCLGNCIGCTHWAYDEDAKRKRCINPKLEKLKGDSE